MNIDQMIDDIYDGYDIAYQECDMSLEEMLMIEEIIEMFGEDDDNG